VEEQGRPEKIGRVTVILPTLDEVENIDGAVAAVLKACDKASLDLEVLVVDDASTDGTRERVRAWESEDRRVHLLVRQGERGLAGAVLAGARFASGDVVVVMDADLSHPAEGVPALVSPVLEDACDMVIGSRYVPGGATPGWSWGRRVLSRGAAALARLLVDARDPCSGFFAVRRETLLEAGKAPGGFKIVLELLALPSPPWRTCSWTGRRDGGFALRGRMSRSCSLSFWCRRYSCGTRSTAGLRSSFRARSAGAGRQALSLPPSSGTC